MQIQVHTDHHTEGGEKFSAYVSTLVQAALGHVSARISRVEVHVSDANGSKKGEDDKRCMMEARLEGHQPIAVTQKAGSVDEALTGAAEKLLKAVQNTLQRLEGAR